MNKFIIEEKIGADLSQELINFMVNHRIEEYGENTKNFENNERESVFFFLKVEDEIKAFGMLKPVKISYKLRDYQIMGMANVIAVEKSKGYGTILMNHVRNYLEKNRFICIGNTYKDNFEFYEKCGFTFVPGLVDRFVYIDTDGKEHWGDWEDYDMFIYDKDNKFDEVLNGKDKIVVRVPLW
jgi:GNAT superfamily N-acetyltransferase